MFCNRQQPSAVRNTPPAVATRDAAFQQPTMYSFEALAGNLGLPTNDTFQTQPWGLWGTTGAFSYKALAPNSQLARLEICSVAACQEETTKGRNESETACYNRQLSKLPTQTSLHGEEHRKERDEVLFEHCLNRSKPRKLAMSFHQNSGK